MPYLCTGVQGKWWIAYIGETVGTLETRVKEHRNASQKGALEKSTLAEHAWMNHHSINQAVEGSLRE